MQQDDVGRVRALGWDDLLALWHAMRARTLVGWGSGKALEHLVLRAFELDGAAIAWPYTVEIDGHVVEQIDGAVHLGGMSCLIECKDTAAAVTVEPVVKLRNQLLRRHASVIGSIFTTSRFTVPATILASHMGPQAVLLWTGDEVAHVLERRMIGYALRRKYQVALERATADFNVMSEDVFS